MTNNLDDLFLHQWDALQEVLRRDFRLELTKCEGDPDCADLHRLNVTRNIRLLKVINPKRQTLHENLFVPSMGAAAEWSMPIQPCIEYIAFCGYPYKTCWHQNDLCTGILSMKQTNMGIMWRTTKFSEVRSW